MLWRWLRKDVTMCRSSLLLRSTTFVDIVTMALRRIERDASASSGAGLWHGSLQPRRPTPSVAAVASALTARVAEALLMAWRAIVRFCQGTQTQASRGRYERIEQVAEAV